jgi:hypothetical protein
VGVYRISMRTVRPAQFVVGAFVFAFGLLAGVGFAAWMILPV